MKLRIDREMFEARAAAMPADYRIEVMRHSHPDDEVLLIEARDYVRLVRKYGGRVDPALMSHAFPSIWHRGKRLVQALWRWLRAGAPVADRVRLWQRKRICQACPHWEPGRLGGQCGLCGCATEAKLRLATERCPDNPPRW